jgi:hypothetical protein
VRWRCLVGDRALGRVREGERECTQTEAAPVRDVLSVLQLESDWRASSPRPLPCCSSVATSGRRLAPVLHCNAGKETLQRPC